MPLFAYVISGYVFASHPTLRTLGVLGVDTTLNALLFGLFISVMRNTIIITVDGFSMYIVLRTGDIQSEQRICMRYIM